MNNWIKLKLSSAPLEILDGDRGKNYPKQNELSETGDCLFLSARNVTSNGFSFTDTSFISYEKDRLLGKGKLIRNDIILTTRGTVGNVAFYSTKIPFDDIRINSGMVIIRPNVREMTPEFTYYLFISLEEEFEIFGSGSAQPQLPIRDLEQISFFSPPRTKSHSRYYQA